MLFFHVYSAESDVEANADDDKEEINWEEIKEQRADEIMALESIYGSGFTELISNRVWIIKLQLEHLSALLEKQSCGAKGLSLRRQNFTSQKKDTTGGKLCEFYQKGACRFGRNCKYKHVLFRDAHQPEAYYNQPEKEAESEEATYPFKVEIRFPEGNKYPLEPPFVAFSTMNGSLPEHSCLNISGRMIKEAKELAADGLPAVFTMISLLDDQDIIEELVKMPPQHYSLPEPIISPFRAEESARRQFEFTKSSDCADDLAFNVPAQSFTKRCVPSDSHLSKSNFQNFR